MRSPHTKKHSYSKDELVECAYGRLFGEGNAQLPLNEMLMVDRIINIDSENGKYQMGQIIAELDIIPDHWFFKCHFYKDPVMPGCLGLDAMWQLIGFYLGWLGNIGRGRAIGVGEVRFSGQIRPDVDKITYQIDLKKIITRKIILGIADGVIYVNNNVIYTANELKVGLFNQQNL